MPTQRSYRIDALARGLAVLDALAEAEGGVLSLTEIIARVGLDKSGTFRILETLRECQYVTRDSASKGYRLGPRALALAVAATRSLDVAELAAPTMRGLSLRLQDSVSLGVLEGARVRYIARVPFRRIIQANIDVGTALPAHATSMGKLLLASRPDEEVRAIYAAAPLPALTTKSITSLDALLAELATIRQLGYAVADQELEYGLWGLAVAVHDQQERVCAALSVSSPLNRPHHVPDLLPDLRAAATQISGALGHVPPQEST